MTLAGVCLLLIDRQRLVKTLAAMAALLACCLLGACVLWHLLPRWEVISVASATGGNSRNQNGKRDQGGSKNNNERQGQGGSGGGKDNSGTSGDGGGGSGSANDTSLPFDPPDSPPRGQPVAIVSFHDDYTPRHGSYYFRQDAFSQFNGNRLVRAGESDVDRDVPNDFPIQHTEVPSLGVSPSDPLTQLLDKITGKSPASTAPARDPKTIFRTIATTVSLITAHSRPFGLPNVQSLDSRENADPKTFRLTYHATSRVLKVPTWDLGDCRPGDPSWSPETWKHYLALPDDPRYRKLAEEAVAAAIDDARLKPQYRQSPVFRALAIGRWIEKNTIYARHNLTRVEGVDPTTAFLFGDRRGYCVHIAHAMTYLLRSLGIPARAGAGYAVEPSRRGRGSSLLIQQTDAHEWCEIYLQGIGWVVVDASPERSEEPPPPDADAAAQRYFGEKNRPAPPVEDKKPGSDPEKPGRDYWPWLYGTALAAIACMYLVKAWRRIAPRMAPTRRLYRLCYRAVLDALADVGVARQFGETREEFAQRLSRWAPEFAELTAAHMRHAVGGAESPDRAQWLGLSDRVRSRIAAAVPAYRRFFGILRPMTWLRVH